MTLLAEKLRCLGIEAKVLVVGPAEVVVLETNRPLSRAQAEDLRAIWAEYVPGVKVAVLDSDLRVRAASDQELRGPEREGEGD